MSEGRYAAWLLDFDGTLYRAGPVKWAMGAELLVLGARHVGTLRRFRHEHEHLRATLCDEVEDPFHLQLTRTAEALKRDPEHVRGIVHAWMFERPQKWIRRWARHALLQQARDFHALGGKLAVVSDYPVSHKLRAIQPELPLSAVVANGEQGGPRRLKPYPDGFLRAAERLGVAPEQCLVIGDRLDADGEAAERAGMAFRHIK